MPELVVCNEDGSPQTVAYHVLPSLLLNEYQKQNYKLANTEEKLKATQTILANVEAEVEKMKRAIELLKAALLKITKVASVKLSGSVVNFISIYDEDDMGDKIRKALIIAILIGLDGQSYAAMAACTAPTGTYVGMATRTNIQKTDTYITASSNVVMKYKFNLTYNSSSSTPITGSVYYHGFGSGDNWGSTVSIKSSSFDSSDCSGKIAIRAQYYTVDWNYHFYSTNLGTELHIIQVPNLDTAGIYNSDGYLLFSEFTLQKIK